MHELKVSKIGNSLSMRLTKEILAQLGAEEGDTLFLTELPDGGFRVTPYNPEFKAAMDAATVALKRRRQVLHALKD